jgi:NOL1/NOP2/sun family putative RNA methylase
MRFPDKFIERYQTLMPDFDAFMQAMTRPLRTCLRVNTLKAEPERILTRLKDLELEPLPWYEHGFRLKYPLSLGNRLEHFLGLFYVQEAASMLPPLALAPQPHEFILDVAAAPGSKTTQIAQMMGNTGLIVANDNNRKRIRGLTGNIDRSGTLNAAVTCQPGQVFGKFLPGYFDRVLLDAPCSSEGTIRKSTSALDLWSESMIDRLARTQIGLLVAAWRALKPGGVLVYSTCTFAPEEDEGVLDYFFNRTPDARSEAVTLPGLKTRPALESWRQQQFHSQVRNALRIMPQDNDTEGFFLCRIRKGEVRSQKSEGGMQNGREGNAECKMQNADCRIESPIVLLNPGTPFPAGRHDH